MPKSVSTNKLPATTRFSNELLDSMRQVTDKPADEIINRMFSNDALRLELRTYLDKLKTNQQLTELAVPAGMESLISAASKLPEWADSASLNLGSAFFARYAQPITQLLGLLSLPFCYAAADGARVLYLSERIKNDPAKRLLDTAVFIWDVMAPDAFLPTGKGFSSILKIRLIHAAARYYTLKSGQWNDAWGKPINQEDMAGTNLALSFITVRGLRKMGISIEYSSQQHFIHLWNVIGSLSGINDSLLPGEGRNVTRLEETIRKRHFKSSEHGVALTLSLINYFSSVDFGSKKIKTSFIPLMRYLLGNETADMLKIPAAIFSPADLFALKTLNFVKAFKNSPAFEYDLQKKNFDQFSKMIVSAQALPTPAQPIN